jgi:hypothetical protein
LSQNNELRRKDIIKQVGCCPVCYGLLSVHEDHPGSLPYTTTCHCCNQYYDSYHGMGDSFGHVGKFSWGGEMWNEQAYLQAILDVRKEYNIVEEDIDV